MLADYHVHTSFSEDSQCPMEAMIRQALNLGLKEIAFTEHVDYGVDTVINCDYPSYFAMLGRMRQKYGGQIKIRGGIEFGVQTHTIPLYRADADRYPFDFIILSIHQVNNLEFWNQGFQRGKSQAEVHEAYYNEIYQVIRQYRGYSVLGHLDMIRRYDLEGDYPYENTAGIIDQILRQVIADGKGIEVNTSCFRYGLADLTPQKAILRRYRELGGTILTIGSDAHQTDQLGAHFAEVRETLKDLGFRYFCTFENRKEQYHPL